MFIHNCNEDHAATLLFDLSQERVPSGPYEGKTIGDMPLQYIDEEVSKWGRTLFVRKCESAVDLCWYFNNQAGKNTKVDVPSSLTVDEFIEIVFTEDGEVKTPLYELTFGV